MMTKFKKTFFISLLLITLITFLETLSFFLVKVIAKNPLIIKSKKYYTYEMARNELKEYNNLIPYINGESISQSILENKNIFKPSMFYETFTEFKQNKNENILIQGDSWAHSANKKIIKKKLTFFANQNNYGLINAGTISYSISPITVQLDVLTKKFKLKPSIVLAIIDQTDFGDELHRYQSLNLNNLSLQDTQINNEFKKKFIDIIDGKKINSAKLILMFKEFYSSRYLQFNRNHFTTIKYIFKRIFYLTTKTPTVLAPLKYGLSDVERRLIIYRFNKYIDNVFSKGVKQLIFVSHPHKNHLIKEKYYKEEIGNFLENIINKSRHSKNIKHINFSKNFKQIYKNYEFDQIFLQNDSTSHLTDKTYEKIFYPYILEKFID
jgi:hypothetical protein|tara:strand:+ start:796 stop:1935 length:1140 start_codon:yes stop_codon:yes gene_type:complete